MSWGDPIPKKGPEIPIGPLYPKSGQIFPAPTPPPPPGQPPMEQREGNKGGPERRG